MFEREPWNGGFFIFREHSTGVGLDQKAVMWGKQFDSLDENTGLTVDSRYGDLCGFFHWEKDSRDVGAWGICIPAKVVSNGEDVLLRPIASQALDLDSSFATKALVGAAATNDSTKVRYLTDDAPEEGDYGLVVQCANQNSSEQIFFPLGGGGSASVYARVAWNFENGGNGDESEGQIVTYTPQGELFWTPTETLIWVDYERSKAAKFTTGGDKTIFEVRKIQSEVEKRGIKRDLYAVVGCIDDGGAEISHFYSVKKDVDFSGLIGLYLSDDLVDEPWGDPFNARILTTIGSVKVENSAKIRMPAEWNIGGIEAFEFLEISDLSRGLPLYFRPIRPALKDNVQPIYDSAVKNSGPEPTSIATYRRFEDA